LATTGGWSAASAVSISNTIRIKRADVLKLEHFRDKEPQKRRTETRNTEQIKWNESRFCGTLLCSKTNFGLAICVATSRPSSQSSGSSFHASSA
jgi:hypothetical protein